jgi:hypothetical protein
MLCGTFINSGTKEGSTAKEHNVSSLKQETVSIDGKGPLEVTYTNAVRKKSS